ncbi:nucleotide exchange factor GrpE [Rhodococcus koreensis]
MTAKAWATDIDGVETWLLIAITAAVLILAGVAIGTLIGNRGPRGDQWNPADHPPPLPPPTPSTSPAGDRALATVISQRAALIAGCVRVRGLLDDQVLSDVLDQTLHTGGVEIFDPTGAPLDPTRHRVTGTAPAPEPRANGVIATTETPGYLDDGKVVRPAEVIVYKWDGR